MSSPSTPSSSGRSRIKSVVLRNAWKQHLTVTNDKGTTTSDAYAWAAAGSPISTRSHFSLLRYVPQQPPVPLYKPESGVQVLLRFGSPPKYVGTEQDGVLKVVNSPNSFCIWTMQAYEGGFFSLMHPTRRTLISKDNTLAFGEPDAGWEKMFQIEAVEPNATSVSANAASSGAPIVSTAAAATTVASASSALASGLGMPGVPGMAPPVPTRTVTSGGAAPPSIPGMPSTTAAAGTSGPAVPAGLPPSLAAAAGAAGRPPGNPSAVQLPGYPSYSSGPVAGTMGARPGMPGMPGMAGAGLTGAAPPGMSTGLPPGMGPAAAPSAANMYAAAAARASLLGPGAALSRPMPTASSTGGALVAPGAGAAAAAATAAAAAAAGGARPALVGGGSAPGAAAAAAAAAGADGGASKPARPPGAPTANLTTAVSIRDTKERFITRPRIGSAFEFHKLKIKKQASEAAYFHIHLVSDTKMWRTETFDLNAGHKQRMLLQCADTELYLGVDKSTGKLLEQKEIDHAVVWEFLKLPHSPLAFALVHIESQKMLAVEESRRARLVVIEREAKPEPYSQFMLYMPANVAQAIQIQNTEKKKWITKAMPYISAVGALGGMITAGALVGNIIRASQQTQPQPNIFPSPNGPAGPQIPPGGAAPPAPPAGRAVDVRSSNKALLVSTSAHPSGTDPPVARSLHERAVDDGPWRREDGGTIDTLASPLPEPLPATSFSEHAFDAPTTGANSPFHSLDGVTTQVAEGFLEAEGEATATKVTAVDPESLAESLPMFSSSNVDSLPLTSGFSESEPL